MSERHRVFLETRGTLAYLPAALRWSVRVEVLMFALLFGTVIGLFAGSIAGMWLVVPLVCGVMSWFSAVLARATWGYGDPPRVDTEQLLTIGLQTLRILFLAVCVLLLYLAVYGVSPTGARVFASIIGLLAPAALVLHAVEDALPPMLHPGRLLRVLVMGGPFGWVLAVVTSWLLERGLHAIVTGSTEFEVVSMIAFGPRIEQVAGTVASIWALSLLMHQYGHALHHRHEAVGLGVMQESAGDAERTAARRDAAVERIARGLITALEQEDRLTAHRLAAVPPPEGVEALDYFVALWERLCRDHKYPVALLVAKRLVAEAARRKRHALAYETLLVAWRESPSFEPGPETRLAIARGLLAAGDKDAFKRVADLDPTTWPDDPAALELSRLREELS